MKRFAAPAFLLLTSLSLLNAAPTLRLVNSTVGPIPVAVGATVPAQTVEAYNIGDGSLSLTVTSSVPWITPTVGTTRACQSTTAAGNCIPLQLALATSSLAAGTYTGIVTVAGDAPTVDAPQTITVTVRVGGIDVFAGPGTKQTFSFTTNHNVTPSASTESGGQWLSVALEGTGSFRFVYPYTITLNPDASMAEGNYNGTVTTKGSSVAAENVTIPVTMHVTQQPVAQATLYGQPIDALNVRLAEGAPPLVYPFSFPVTVSNIGAGTISAQNPTASGGAWIKTDPAIASYIAIDPTGLTAGSTNTGTITINSNAINGPTTVPVNLQIVPKGPPLVYFQQVINNAPPYQPGDTVAQGAILALKGEQLSFQPFTPGQAPPLATHVADTTVLVNGTPAPIYYTSYGQIVFQMPVDAPVGTALIQVKRDDGQTSNTVTVDVAQRAPRIVAVVNQDFSVNFAGGGHPAKAGDVLTIYAIGLGPTTPAVPTGAPAPSTEPFARVSGDLRVDFGGNVVAPMAIPLFAGMTPTYAGLYQINVAVPANPPKGVVDLSVAFPNARSNSLKIEIQ